MDERGMFMKQERLSRYENNAVLCSAPVPPVVFIKSALHGAEKQRP